MVPAAQQGNLVDANSTTTIIARAGHPEKKLPGPCHTMHCSGGGVTQLMNMTKGPNEILENMPFCFLVFTNIYLLRSLRGLSRLIILFTNTLYSINT